MAITSKLNQRLRARAEEDDFEDFSEESGADEVSEDGQSEEDEEQDGNDRSDDNDEDSQEDEEDQDAESNPSDDPDITPSLNTISFGALAKAQASLGKRKRPSASATDSTSKRPKTPGTRHSPAPSDSASSEEEDQPQSQSNDYTKKPRQTLTHRTSKHAPTVQSSRHAVTRKRTVVEPPPIPKARDPRFDSLVLNKNQNPASATNAAIHASKNYSFLNSYRNDELAQLRKQLSALQYKSGKNKTTQEEEREIVRLKRQITSMNDRIKTFERKEQQREVLKEHKRREREAIREGRKSAPWFMKKGEVKKEAVSKRFAEMSGKEKSRALERRRKKVAGKERKEMPWGRRGAE
ncbi:hypothetical protein AJ79_07562 [Helicocarpus griseus UAMH5409]|uniref:rRNA biogenesis protein RRP36 n=1 Tax=Helicocarpus griseus UAMH5409 TaxID=1447875 RepID=A0A2B7X1K2_9EURO|nr:hypothetical protein AJ79_07562 [Helicocarpus griseus UAMH5409]